MNKWISPDLSFERINAFTDIFASPESLKDQSNYNDGWDTAIGQYAVAGTYMNGESVAAGKWISCSAVHYHKTVPNAYWCVSVMIA